MKLRAYLVDDEPLALERLRRLLERTGRVEVTGSTTEPENAVAALTADPPDVCFLDIQMPRLDGFEVLARLPKQPIVIFTTAYDRFALKAFGVNSVDYLLKPIEPESLDRALRKVDGLRAGPLAQPDLEAYARPVAVRLQPFDQAGITLDDACLAPNLHSLTDPEIDEEDHGLRIVG